MLEEILWEMAVENGSGNAVGNGLGNAAGNGLGNVLVGTWEWTLGNGLSNDAFFSLNRWLRMIYCLQTIHEPACVILTLFNI